MKNLSGFGKDRNTTGKLGYNDGQDSFNPKLNSEDLLKEKYKLKGGTF